MTQQQTDRSEEIARVHGYLASQGAKRTPAEIVEALRQAHAELLAALDRVPDAAFHTAPAEGEWSAADVLAHVRAMALIDDHLIPAAIRGEQAPRAGVRDQIEPAPPGATRAQLLDDLNAARERLIAAALAADPQAHLAVVDQQEGARLHRREQLRVRHAHPGGIAGRGVEV